MKSRATPEVPMEPSCPCCNEPLHLHSVVETGSMHHCTTCLGMLAEDGWLNHNIPNANLRTIKTSVFAGEPAGYRCPKCSGEMVSGQVPSPDGTTIEVDGCIGCGSLWFDNREMEPFVPSFSEISAARNPIGAAIEKIAEKLTPDQDDPEDDEDSDITI